MTDELKLGERAILELPEFDSDVEFNRDTVDEFTLWAGIHMIALSKENIRQMAELAGYTVTDR